MNHDQQLTVYASLAQKLGISRKNNNRVAKPTSFINSHSPDRPVDVVLVNEAHLLWTQGKQSYRGENQLKDLLDRAKVVVAIFDPDQVLNTNQYWEESSMLWLASRADSHIELNMQMRIDAAVSTMNWIRSFVRDGKILPISHDPSYDLRIYDDPSMMYRDIRKISDDETLGLSRMLATFDWPTVARVGPPRDKRGMSPSVTFRSRGICRLA